MTDTCDNCGATVSDAYARVNASRDGTLRSCPECNGDRTDGRAVSGTLYSLQQTAS